MITGVETAGIVLGVFPLCIELIKLYATATQTIKDMLHHHRILREYARELKLERCKLYDSLLNLFEDSVTTEDCVQIFQNPDVEGRLKQRLEGRSYATESFIDALKAMKNELEEIEQAFPDTPATGRHVQCESKEYQKFLKKVGKTLRKQFTLALLKEEYSERMNRIRGINQSISTLVHGALQCSANLNACEASRNSLRNVENYYQRVREGAQSICDLLKNRSQKPHSCELSSRHGISLSLEARDATRKLRQPSRTNAMKISFRVMVCVDHGTAVARKSWKALEIEMVGNEGPDTTQIRHKAVPRSQNAPLIHVQGEDEPIQSTITSRKKSDITSLRMTASPSTSGAHQAAVLTLNSRPTTPTKQGGFFKNLGNRVRNSGILRHSRSASSFNGDEEGQIPEVDGPFERRSNTPPKGRSQVPTSSDQVRKVRFHQTGGATTSTCSISDTPRVHPIQDLCLIIKQPTTTIERTYLGLLQSDSGRQACHRVWSMPAGSWFNIVDGSQLQHSTISLTEPISLQLLLENSTYTRSISFPLKQRLLLGVKLASAVIQLYHTWWLSESWSKQDIIFFADPRTNNPLITNPMVLHDLNGTTDTSVSAGSGSVPRGRQGVICRKNKTLFSLGLVLCELWFRKRLEDLYDGDVDIEKVQQFDYSQVSDKQLLVIADQVLDKLYEHALPNYCDVVKACFFDNIPTESKEFITTVWQKVLRPLEENYKSIDPERIEQ